MAHEAPTQREGDSIKPVLIPWYEDRHPLTFDMVTSIPTDDLDGMREVFESIHNYKFLPESLTRYIRQHIEIGAELFGESIFSEQYREDYGGLMARFERDALGLSHPEGGVFWWASPAGGSGAGYPIENMATLVDISPEELEALVAQEEENRWLMIQAGNWLVPFLVPGQGHTDTLRVDGVLELTELGIRYLDRVIWTALGLSDINPSASTNR